jgi:transcription elongation factor GreA
MQVPWRKPDKYLRGKPDPKMTVKKYRELEAKLAGLKKVRPVLGEEVKRLAAMGDFSENAAYQIAKGRLRGINQGILETEELLTRAEIIEPKKNSDRVEIGGTVTIENSKGLKKIYQILGSTETDPASGIISASSPLGSALLGKKINDKINITLAGKTTEYTILEIG